MLTRLALATSLLLCAVDLVNAQLTQASTKLTEEQLIKIQLPMDPTDPILEYDSTGGFRMALPQGFVSTPILRVYADGKVVTGGSAPEAKSCETKLSESQLNQLLHWVVNEKKFYEIDEQEIKRQLLESGNAMMVADAATSQFKLNLQRGSHQVDVYALMMMAPRNKEVEEMQTLLDVQRRCQLLVAKTTIGDDEEMRVLLEAVNSEFAKSQPNLNKFLANDVTFATRYKDGRYRVSLRKTFEKSGELPSRRFTARVMQNSPDGELAVSISGAVPLRN
jgi:hypothetical protein